MNMMSAAELAPTAAVVYQKWICRVCDWIYDEALGDPEHGLAAGTTLAAIPDTWSCPECGVTKADFEVYEE